MTTTSDTKRATYSLYGCKGAGRRTTGDGTVRYVPADPERESPIKALARRVERETGYHCWPVRHDSDSVRRDGTVESSTYEITLVRAVPRRLGGGYSVEGSLWATVSRID